MAKLGIDYEVTMADGRTLCVHIDQREWAKMEAQEFPDTSTLTRARFLAWAGLRRQAQYNGSWERFNEVDAANVEDISAADPEPDAQDEQGAGDEQGLDPGPPATPDASTSPSPAPRAAPSKKSSRGTRGTSTPTSS